MTRPEGLIDVWSALTFDDELRGDLDAHADLIRDFYQTSKRLGLEREASDHRMPYPQNPYGPEFVWVKEHIMRLMEQRTIRAWHYTRMTGAEIEALRHDGIFLSTLATIRARLDAQVAAGALGPDLADRLFAKSPFYSDQFEGRSKRFWMTSHPIAIEDSGVEPLLECWGGESVYFWQDDPEAQDILNRIGRPRILEIAMPMSLSQHAFWAAEAVIATYGRLLGCRPEKGAFDIYTQSSLPAAHLLAVHSAGETDFANMARGFPADYVDVRLAGDLTG